MRELMWMAGKAFLIALILTPIVRDIFRSYNLVDRPGKRKVHRYPIPRVGGIAIAIAYGVAVLSTSKSDDPLSTSGLAAWQLIPAAAVVFLTGLLDDLFSLRPVVKLLGLVVAGSLVFWSGLRIEGVAQHSLPIWLNYPVTVFWLLLASNAFNLIDGLDGLCAGMGLLASLTLFAAALLSHQMPLAAATLPLAGALLGFLCYNVNPATVFLGRLRGAIDRIPAGLLRNGLDTESFHPAELSGAAAGALDSAAGCIALGSAAHAAPEVHLRRGS